MGYAVKHSTSNVDNTFRKGNVALGVSSEGYEDTSTSGLYSGVAPVAGKHNLVVTSATGDPDFYCVDDSELVLLAQNLGGSVNTSLEAKNYLNSRSDTVFTEGFISSNIVTDGLVLNLDAKNQSSFLDNQPTTNLVSNPDFSNSTIGWNSNQNTTLSIEIINGTRFLKVKSNQTTSTPGFKSGNITVSGNTTYTLTIRAYKNDSQSIFLYATGNGTGGSDIVWSNASYNGPNPITTELTTISRTFTTPSDMTYLQIGALWSGPLTTSEVYVEYMQLEEKSTATSFISGSRSQNTTWYDLSGNGYNATLYNSPSFLDGKFVLDNADDYILASFNEGVLKQTNQSGTWTIETSFIYNGNSSNNEAIIAGRSGHHGGIYMYNNDILRHAVKTNQGWTGAVNTAIATLQDGKGYHTVMTYNNGTVKSYLNGEYVSTSTLDLNTYDMRTYDNTFYIGGISNRYNDISLETVKCYTNELSLSEVQQNYYSGPIVTDGLVLAVDAGNLVSYESGSTIVYNMTGSTSGSLNNGTAYLSNNGGTWDFDGSDDTITVKSNYTFSSGESYTYEVWFNPTTDNTTSGLIGGQNNPMLRWGQGSPSGKIYFFCGYSESPGYIGVLSNSILSVGEWHHAMATLDSVNKVGKLYINGEYETQFTWNTGTVSVPPSTILFNIRDSSNAYLGKISIGRVYNRTLSSDEVLQNYNAQKARFI